MNGSPRIFEMQIKNVCCILFDFKIGHDFIRTCLIKTSELLHLPGTNIVVPFVFSEDIKKPFPLKNVRYDERIFNYRLPRARRVAQNYFWNFYF